MQRNEPWNWSESLGGLSPDAERSYLIRTILFGVVQEHCSRQGLEVGEEVRCRSRSTDEVVVELSSGVLRQLDLDYAWFVEVEPTSRDSTGDHGRSPRALGDGSRHPA